MHVDAYTKVEAYDAQQNGGKKRLHLHVRLVGEGVTGIITQGGTWKCSSGDLSGNVSTVKWGYIMLHANLRGFTTFIIRILHTYTIHHPWF